MDKIVRHLERLLTWPSLLQIGGIAVALLVAWWIGQRVSASQQARAIVMRPGFANRLGEALIIVSSHSVALLLVATLLGFLYAMQADAKIVAVVLQLVGLLLLIRLVVYVLRVSVGDRAPIKGWGTTISLIVWIGLSLHVLGWLDSVATALDSIGIQAGKTRISVWSVVKLLITVTAFVLLAAWIARWIERRLMALSSVAISTRIGIAKFAQAFLIGLSILIGLNAAGLDLTTLTVLTGAIGIGLGFGLQAIASNFVSGFVLLMDRSIKPGDVISLAGLTGGLPEHFGWVQELRGRYVVVRDRDGVETLVPNQHLITNPVINWSYADPRVRLHLPVRVSYKDDPELALQLLTKATEGNERVLREPAPVARLMAFGDSGFELELRFWISDPQEGVNNVRSDVNRSIWKLFKDYGVSIPLAQREVLFEMKTPQQKVVREGDRPAALDP
ncbi:MAG: mechanosensitive ion channel [Candidatus Obscuribacterales bacterium]|nr:mechanosensitive ion channel [Steroidobacteraceae bacterium]